MQRRIIIVTPVHPAAAQFLPDAYKSLREQVLPEGWDWLWLIQEDGKSDDVAPFVPDDARVSFSQGRPGCGDGPDHRARTGRRRVRQGAGR